jgi:hypothetical protein
MITLAIICIIRNLRLPKNNSVYIKYNELKRYITKGTTYWDTIIQLDHKWYVKLDYISFIRFTYYYLFER